MKIVLFLFISLIGFAKEVSYLEALQNYDKARYMSYKGECKETVKVVDLDETLKESVGILFEGYFVDGKLSKKEIYTKFYLVKNGITVKTEEKTVRFYKSKNECKRSFK